MQTIHYELHELERTMLTHWETHPADEPVDKQLLSIISSEAVRAREALTLGVCSFHDECHLGRYIRHHQQALIRLLDLTSVRLSKDVEKHASAVHDKYFYQTLVDLLDFVERHFEKYVDPDTKAPEAYIATARHDAQQQLVTLQQQFSLLQVDPSLVDIVLHAFRKLISCQHKRDITYRNVMYVQEWQKELFQVVDNASPEILLDDALLQRMYYLNYNAMRCFTWHTKHLASQLAGAQTHEERIEVLSLMLKKVNQSQVKPSIAYHPQSPPLKTQLAAYIAEEMDYEERIFQVANFPRHTTDLATQPLTLKLELPVAQISYLIRIFVEMNVVLNKNVHETLRFFARHTASKRAGSITFGSLRAKYYENESSTKESVKNVLHSMIRYIEKE